MKQEIDNNAMWAAFRQELALQGELQVVAAIDNALNNLGFTIEETSTIVPISLKQGEQKPMPIFKVGETIIAKDGTSIIKEPFHIDSIEDGCYWDGENTILICNQDEFELVEQKNAWSEEDKNVWLDIKSLIDSLLSDGGNSDYTTYELQKMWDWLDTIWQKDRVQPKKEWSEEDENLLKLSIENLTELKDRFGEDYGRVGGCIDWLKSLKDRYTWKPSKEQMEYLHKYAEQNNYDGAILTSLYKDLKQLKQL